MCGQVSIFCLWIASVTQLRSAVLFLRTSNGARGHSSRAAPGVAARRWRRGCAWQTAPLQVMATGRGRLNRPHPSVSPAPPSPPPPSPCSRHLPAAGSGQGKLIIVAFRARYVATGRSHKSGSSTGRWPQPQWAQQVSSVGRRGQVSAT